MVWLGLGKDHETFGFTQDEKTLVSWVKLACATHHSSLTTIPLEIFLL